MSDKVIMLVYVDDTFFYSPRKEWIDEAVQQIKQQELELEIEDSVASFLGEQANSNLTSPPRLWKLSTTL